MKCTQRPRACKATPSGDVVPSSLALSKLEYGLEVAWPTTKPKAPREGWVSAAATCHVTTNEPASLESSAVANTDPLETTGNATCLPDGLNTLMPAPAGVTCSVKNNETERGTECRTALGAGSD